MRQTSVRGQADFQRLWTAATVSQFGSAIGRVGIPVIAVGALAASTFQIALLAVVGSLTAAVIAFPFGSHIEFRRKRPILVASDLVQAAGVLSIPVAAAFGVLTFPQLCVVTAVTAAGQLATSTAAGAHLKALVPPQMLVDANGRLQSSTWLTLTAGPGVGGALLAVASAPVVFVVDAMSFLADAILIRAIRKPEPAPPARTRGESRWVTLAGGWRFTRHHPELRRMLASWVLFAGANGMTAPILTVFYLRDLHFSQWQYGVVLGVPSIGGFLGARLTRRAAARAGAVRAVWWASLARSPWFFVTPLAPPGAVGFVLCGGAFFGCLVFAALANSAMAAYRQLVTPSEVMARTSALWRFMTVATTPLFILAGGALATWFTDRGALLIAATLMFVSVFLLPSGARRGRAGAGGATAAARAEQDGADAGRVASRVPARQLEPSTTPSAAPDTTGQAR